MAENTKVSITIGLDHIEFGEAKPDGTMPEASAMQKIGKVYENTCTVTQDKAEVTEHYEEGKSVPFYRKKRKKAPVVAFSLVVEDLQQLVDTVGGELITDGGTVKGWGFNGDETPNDISLKAVTKEGLDIEIPNGDIDAVCNEDLGGDGLFRVDCEVTPLAVADGKKAYRRVKKS